MSDQDQAARDAAKYLPCTGANTNPPATTCNWDSDDPADHDIACAVQHRPVVTSALRERDERIAELEREFGEWIDRTADERWRKAVDDEAATNLKVAVLGAENARLRELVISAVYQWASYDTVEGRRYASMASSTLEEMFDALGLKDRTYTGPELRAALEELK